ncbi:MAG: isocitrate lyase/PEP mutase family protein [Gammaproteobacteria bacterium]
MHEITTQDDVRRSFAARVRRRELSIAPGVFDMISLRVADAQGHAALYMTGYGTVASLLGLADAGLAGYAEMVERARTMAGAARTPLIADADTGFGGLLNVARTVRGYEDAGVAAIQIEDQVFPKKCGHTPGRRVVPLEEMTRKIEVACAARREPDFLIIARTDARTGLGLDEAIRRACAYREAGADVIFVEAPESEDEFAQVAAAVDAPLLANMVEGGRSPLLSAARLAELGYAIAIYPASGFLAATAALEAAYRHLLVTGSTHNLPCPSYPLAEMHRLLGFEEVWAFERCWAQEQEPEESP